MVIAASQHLTRAAIVHTFVKVNKSSQTTVKQSPKPTKPAMSREDRDLWNRKIISTLNLSESDRSHLRNVRGLTDQQIDNCSDLQY